MNIYRGCHHGCIYCDSRSECYKIENFDKVVAKENALEVIRDDLRRKVKKGIVATGAMSDPYNALEEKLQLTRHALELISATGFGVFIATKSCLIERDIDVLLEIKENSPVIVAMTITTFDDKLGKIIEPNVSETSERFETLKKLREAGIFAGILLMPILPFINDSEENILNIINESKKVGVKFIYPYFGVTLRDSQREYFYNKLDENPDGNFKGLKEKYIKRFGNAYNCKSPNYKKLSGIFKSECDKNEILYNMSDIIKNYKLGYYYEQLKLF